MAIEVMDITCPGCGAPIDTKLAKCYQCGRPYVITSFNNVYGMTPNIAMGLKGAYQREVEANPDNPEANFSLGICLLKLNMYDKAYDKFDKAIEDSIDNPEAYFWAAVSLLKGKRAFLTPKATIDKALELTDTARMLEERGIFSYFCAYLKYDYYNLKRLNIQPSYVEELQRAATNVTQEDIRMLAEILKIEEFDANLSI